MDLKSISPWHIFGIENRYLSAGLLFGGPIVGHHLLVAFFAKVCDLPYDSEYVPQSTYAGSSGGHLKSTIHPVHSTAGDACAVLMTIGKQSPDH